MRGLLVKLTPAQLPSIGKNRQIKVSKDIIRQLQSFRRELNETLEGLAVIGVQPTPKGRLVVLTAQIVSISSDQTALKLKFLKEHKDKSRWLLPSGYGESHEFKTESYEFLEMEEDVISCLLKSPEALFRSGKIQLPFGFNWNPSAAANLIVEFDAKGKAALTSRKAFERHAVSSLRNYTEALNQVWACMSGREFEEAMQELFTSMGFQVEITKRGGDEGVDLYLVRQDAVLGSDNYVVQCKKYDVNRKVRANVVRDLRGTAQAKKAQRGLIVTTASFTKDAVDEAQNDGVPIELVDGTGLGRLTLPRVHELPSVRRLLEQ